MKQNPFSLYDILGYIIPGSFLLYMFYLITLVKDLSYHNISIKFLINSFPSLNTEGTIFMLILAYSLGHILSFLSSITVEKYSIWKYGYPSRYLLNINQTRLRNHFKSFHGIFWMIIMTALLLPTVILDFILGNGFNFREFYVRPIDPILTKITLLKINKLTNQLGINQENGFGKGEGNNSDFFRIVQHYTYENSNHHQDKFRNYVALYGFLRTMTLIMNILFWYLILHFYFYGEFNIVVISLIILVSLIAYIFYMAFLKFYRRFTLEGFMVLIVDKKIE